MTLDPRPLSAEEEATLRYHPSRDGDMDPDPHGEWVRYAPDALREALYRVAGSMTDDRLAELMRAAAVPLHGHPIHNAAGYIAAILRADMKEGIDAALAQGRLTDE